MTLPTISECCEPRREVLAGELPDAIFAADLWDVILGRAHKDYQYPLQFFEGTHPTESLKRVVKDVAKRLAGVQGVTPFYKLETGFVDGNTQRLYACSHQAVCRPAVPRPAPSTRPPFSKRAYNATPPARANRNQIYATFQPA